MKMILAAALMLGGLSYPAAAQNEESSNRQGFRNMINSLAAQSQSSPLVCERTYPNGNKKQLRYKFSVEEYPRYKDAFFLNFVDEQLNYYSTLVAYEGEGGAIKGELSVRETNGETVYRFVYRGAGTDVTELGARNGKLEGMFYSKSNGRELLYTLDCNARME